METGGSDDEGIRDHPGDDGENGRGLLLVEAIAAKWGWHDTATGRVTWFETTIPEASEEGH